ncbi:rRNA small subunit 7-methylguanosine (m7G) methyltransferase GidB [hydrothermal vent metagenome]|uniref:rRNA small subunit 7-methylguanosine (M7G) methyltransferase GidB n=1 Tax=hydrothermal vent metagenome TaxID=652676 RepID=A0A1W1BEH3_9ZZZZ
MLKNYLEEEGILLDDNIIAKLEIFATKLDEWNRVHNLTGAKTIYAIYENIIDSLYPLSFIDVPKTLLDVGTGAGFPGLVLAIALEDTTVILSEPLKKRVAFLKYMRVDLELENLTVEAKKVEQIDAEPFDMITSRAVTNTELLLSLTKNISNNKTQYLFYKGSRVFDEVKDISDKIDYDIIQKNLRNYLYIKSQI